MLILNERYWPIDRVPSFIWLRREQQELATVVGLFGRLIAYLPHAKRPYYTWVIAISYTPGQWLSACELHPPLLQVTLFSRWEFGLVLSDWLLGLRLNQPLVWLKRLQSA